MHYSSEAQHRRMTETPLPKLIGSLALPTVANQLITIIYNTADTWFVSQISTSAAAAVGVVFSLMSIIHAVGYSFAMGAGSMISRHLGAKEDDQARICANSALAIAVLCGSLLLIFGLLTLEPLVRLLGATETILPHAVDYASWILIGAPVMCAANVLGNTLRAEGKAALSTLGLCSGGILNMILDPIFIFVLKMGIGGAAIATILSQTVSFLILLWVYLSGKSIVRLGFCWISRNPRIYLQIIKTGMPTFFRQSMASISSAFMNVQAAAWGGDAAVAAMSISYKVYLWVRNGVLGIGQGFMPVAGYNFGARNYRRVREGFRITCIYGSILSVTCAVILAVFAEPVLHWFRDDPEVIRIGTVALRYGCAVMPFLGYSTFVNQLCQCLGFSKQATVLACCRQGIFFLPLILLLPMVWGLTGVQLTQPLSDFLTFLVSIPYQIYFFRKYLPQ